ncbi:MAG: hypothetical protein N3A01_08095 [Bacteroidales bacterium]|nr:hypothetical protein [Bacteroidales bacterium]
MKSKIIITILIISFTLKCQVIHNNYILVKFGSGINYGGYGFGCEYRLKHLGLSFCGGYKPVQSGFEYYIPASYNFGAELTYYYFFKRNEWQWFNSLYAGWLNNYYEPELYNKTYNPIVYGLAYITGVCIKDEFVNLHVGIAAENGKLIYNKKSHPFYDKNWHFSLSVGFGFNIYSIYKEIKWYCKHKKNYMRKKSIDKVLYYNKDSINKVIDEKIQNIKPLSIIDSCNSPANFLLFLSNDTLFFLKKLSPYQFIYGRILYIENFYHYYQAVSLDSSIYNIQVFFGEGRLNEITNEDLPELIYDFNMIKASSGMILFYAYESEIYLILENLYFIGHNKKSFVNRVEFCKGKINKKK